MKDIIQALFDAAFAVWEGFVDIAYLMFTTSPKTQSGGALYTAAKEIYDGIVSCTVPIATLFFIIAIYKTVSSTPPEQQARKFMLDMFKYVMILYISSQLWDVLGYIIDFSDGITSSISGNASDIYIQTSGSSLEADISTLDLMHNVTFDWDSMDTALGQMFENLGKFMLYLVGGFISIIILAASGLSMVAIAFQRIIKPLLILPFGAIVLGIGACSGEGERMMWHYGKSFLAFCISGAFMVAAIKLGGVLITNCPIDTSNYSGFVATILTIVNVDLTAVVITGLLKSMDGIVSKVFG